MKKLLTLIGVIIITQLTIQAQNLTGVVLDNDTKEALPFVNIACVKNDSIQSITTTDFDGKFTFNIKGKGDYTIKFQFTGYKPNQRIVTVNDALDMSLGQVLLVSNITELEGVTVTAERENVTMTADGMSFNVDDDGGTDMEDIISGMPSITVDENGEVSANGEEVVILVNGEESDLDNPLEEIPMQMIERVELLNNPPAEYTSASSAINIVLKENVKLGNHARILVEAGSPEQYKGNVNVSKSNDRWATTFNFNVKNSTIPYDRTSERLNYGQNARSTTQSDKVMDTRYNVNWTTSYAASANDKFKLSLNYQRLDLENTSDQNELVLNVDTDNLNPRYNYRDIVNQRTIDKFQAQFNYDKHFYTEGRKLITRLRWSIESFDQYNANQTDTEYINDGRYVENDPRLTLRDRPTQNLFALIKYVHPFNDRSTLTTGMRNSTKIQKTNENYYFVSDDGSYTPRGNEYQNTDYLNQKFSGFAQWKYKFYNDLTFSTGVVAENSVITSTIDNVDDNYNTNNNFWVFNPNASLNKKFNESWMGNINYSFRMNTPSDRALNPTVNDNNPLFITMGNPDLQLQKSQKLTLSITNQSDNVSTRLGAFYRNTLDGVERVFTTKGDTVFSSYANIVDKHTMGGNFYVHWHVAKNHSIVFSGNVYNDIYNTRIGDLPLSEWMYNGKVTYKAKFFNHYRVRLTGYYNSTTISYNGTRKPASGVDLSISRYVAKKKGKIWVSVQDVLGTRDYFTTTYSQNFENEFYTDLPTVIRTGISWSFYSI
ncbi:TonB-dependent receptor [Flammeovirga kamogawensis]|uniref:TonB-dependent receptor family protein n=1 Tax=Flammeovirga kamogawensis TaxID=373891 RepID=A0ABX8GYC6_9BACT|nr:TonB-dependent receptor [Flammeovirga kamogawensis]MBB6463936.1 outer membrane receptor protein involved in Fe transport [Flammeovirga kamogawensis]QWG08301.1 TonB-dependent receptor family protein [Flammeovirga kamogawensis]TRX66597.1 TonB-dependent receptor [Flammeovirga kamogawensis]